MRKERIMSKEQSEDKRPGRTLSRRAFLTAMGASGAAMALAACAPAATPAPAAPTAAPPAAPTEVPTEVAAATPTEATAPTAAAAPAAAATGQSLNVIYWADTNDSFKKVMDGFTAETGVTVNYEVAPAAYIEWQQMITTRLASGDTAVDCFHCDDFQAAIYGAAGWLKPLDPIIEEYKIDLTDWPETLIKDVSSWKGVLYRLPWGNDTEIFFYRTDFFDEAGVKPPTTWDELVTVGKALTKGEDRYGIALSGSKGGQLGNEIEHWTNQAGGAINALDKPGSREALVFYKDLFKTHKIAQPSTPQDGYTEVFQAWLDNKYAMWWCWDGFFGAMRTNADFWKNQVSAFLPPKGPDNNTTITGCWGWAIGGFTEKPDLSKQWVEYTARPEVMKLQILRGRVPARVSLWSDPEVQDLAPSAPFLEDLAKAGNLVKARPVTPSIQEIYDAAEESVHAYLTDQIEVDAAIEQAMAKITPILARDLG
jgi:ABC-type glycerol-3-phosphate transport system substrate-binding protein